MSRFKLIYGIGLQSFYRIFAIIHPVMASSGHPSGPGHLANDPYLCDACGRGFPTKEEFDTHRLQHQKL
ncbi:MAG: hypothetical protein ACJ72S_00125 [Nitrososphaeraceae archaeon]